MKKLILTTAIAISLLATTAHATTITSGKKIVKLTAADVSYIMHKGTPSMISTLTNNVNIRNTDIGDNILTLLNSRSGLLLAAKTAR